MCNGQIWKKSMRILCCGSILFVLQSQSQLMGNSNSTGQAGGRENATKPPPLTNESIRAAVRLWCKDPAQVIAEYGRIEEWDTSKVTDMNSLFLNQYLFNDDISGWDVSNVVDMSYMFCDTGAFNQVLSKWNVSNVTDMSGMFLQAKAFNQDLSRWDVSKVTSMYYMFSDATVFNQDLSAWNVSNVTDMGRMFDHASAFNHDVGRWNVSNVTNMSGMFFRATAFNQDLSRWDVSKVTSMYYMFNDAIAFNQDLSAWEVSNVTDSEYMFCGETPLLRPSADYGSVINFNVGKIPREYRCQVFACFFMWQRRRAFIFFLVNHGYLYSASAPNNHEFRSEVAPCDVIFNVEDIYRNICAFL